MEAYAPLNNFFETQIEIGSRRQPLMLVVDTGSSWTWIAFDKCKTDSVSLSNEPIATYQNIDHEDQVEEFLK